MSSRTGSGPSSSRKSIDASMFDPPTAAELAGLDNAGANASDAENDTTSNGATAPAATDRAASSVGGAESEREPDEEDGGSSAGDGELDREILSKTVLRRGLSDIQRAADGGYAFTRLDLSGQGVKTLEGDLASYPELKYLNLSSNELMDLSPLSALPTLLSLNVSYNSLGSLDSLLPCRHDQLQLLQADHNDIEFLFSKAGGPVAAGSKRSSGAAKVSAAAVASGSNALTHLSSNYPSLFALTLSNNKIASLLRGEDSSPASLAALASAPHHSCQILDLAFNQLSNLAGLEAFPELRVLNLQSNKLTSLAGVERLKMLEKINVSENKLSQLGVELARLAKLPRLTHLVITAGNPTLLEELETAFAAAAEAGTASESALAAGVDMTSEILIVLPQLLFLDGKRVGAAARARADATQKDRVADAERRKAEEEEQRKLEEAERKAAAKEAEDEENEDAEKDSDEEEKDEAEADAEADPDAEAAQDGAEQDAEAEEDGAADFDGGDDGGDDQGGQSFDEDGQGDDGGDDAAAESFEDDGAAEEEEEEDQ